MSGNQSSIRAQESPIINVYEPGALVSWCRKYDCTVEELRNALENVGTSVKDVDAWFKK